MTTINSTDVRGSKLERSFILRWSAVKNAPPLVREHPVIPGRRWRFDFAHPETKVAIELDGGIWLGTKGGHGGRGAIRDREKDFEGIMAGWTVIRLTPEMAKDWEVLRRIVNLIRSRLPKAKPSPWRNRQEFDYALWNHLQTVSPLISEAVFDAGSLGLCLVRWHHGRYDNTWFDCLLRISS